MTEELAGAERPTRQRWSEAERRRIVAESSGPVSSVSVVAHRHDVNANLVFKWRQRYGSEPPAGAQLVRAVIAREEATSSVSSGASGRLEIELEGGYRMVAFGEVEATLLCRVIWELRR